MQYPVRACHTTHTGWHVSRRKELGTSHIIFCLSWKSSRFLYTFFHAKPLFWGLSNTAFIRCNSWFLRCKLLDTAELPVHGKWSARTLCVEDQLITCGGQCVSTQLTWDHQSYPYCSVVQGRWLVYSGLHTCNNCTLSLWLTHYGREKYINEM